jgi:hypothetical protein
MHMTPEISHSRKATEAKIPLRSILGEPEPLFRTRRAAIGYPHIYIMILSCVMWNMAFVAAYTGKSWHGSSVPPATISQPKAKTHVPMKATEAKDTIVTRTNEILIGLDQAEESAVPTFEIQSEKRSMGNKKGGAKTSTDNTDFELPLSLLGDDLAIIADTGCTIASSFDPLDFEGPIIPMYPVMRMQGIAETVEIRGRGTIEWTVIDDSGTSRVIRTPGYYLPDTHVRLFSPQAYMRDPTSSCDEFRLSAHAATLVWNSVSGLHTHTLTIPYDDTTTLPRMRAYRNLVNSAEALAAHFCSATDAYLYSVDRHETKLADKVSCTYTPTTDTCASTDKED